MPDPEVTAKLKVSREGDPRAFTEVGQAATDLGERVRELKPSLDQGADALDSIANRARSASPDVADALDAISSGLRQLGDDSGSAKHFEILVADATDRLKELGGTWSDVGDALRELPVEVVDEFRSAAASLEGPLSRAADVASKIQVSPGLAPALASVSTGVDDLHTSVEGLSSPIAEFSGQMTGLRQPLADGAAALRGVASSARETAPAVAEAAEKLATSLEMLGESKSLDEVKTHLDEVRFAMTQLRQSGGESIEGLEVELKGLKTVLADLSKTAHDLDEPLSSAFSHAGASVAEFAQKAEAGLGGGTKAAGAQAQRAIADLEAEIERLKASGANLSDGQVAELGKLKAAHRSAIEEVAANTVAQQKFAKQTDEATIAAKGQIKPIRDVGDLLEQVNPSFARLAAKGLVVWEALKVGYEVLDTVKEKLNQLDKATGGAGDFGDDLLGGFGKIIIGFNGLLKGVDQAALAIVDFNAFLIATKSPLADLSEQVEESANIFAVLRANGIDPTNLSLDEQRASLQLAIEQWRKSAEALAALKGSILGSSDAFEANVGKVSKLLKVLPDIKDLTEPAADSLRDLFGGLVKDSERLGVALPDALKKYAKELGVAITETDRMTAAAKKQADAQGLTVESLHKSASALAALIEQTQAANKNLTGKQLSDIFGDQVQGFIDKAAKLGVGLGSVDALLASYGKEWGIVSTEVEKARERHDKSVDAIVAKVSGLSVSRNQLKDLGRDIVDAAGQLGNLKALEFKNPEAFGRLKDEVQKVIDAYLALGQKVPVALAAVGDAVGVVVGGLDRAAGAQFAFASGGDAVVARSGRVVIALDGERASITNVATASEDAAHRTAVASQQGAAAVEAANTTIAASAEATRVKVGRAADGHLLIYNDLGLGAEEAGRKLAAAGDTAAAGSAGFDQVAEAAKRGGEIAQVGSQAETAGQQVKSGGEAAAGAKEGYDAAAEGLVTFGNANAGAVASVGTLEGKVEDLVGVCEKLSESLDKISGKVNAAADAWIAALDRVLPHLAQVQAQAAATDAALEKVTA